MKRFFKEYAALFTPFWLSRVSLLSWVYLFALLGLSVGFVYLIVYMNRLQGELFNYIESQNNTAITQNLVEYSVLIAVAMILFAFSQLAASLIRFHWRKALTAQMITRWLQSKYYFYQKSAIDNPDQRISDDVNFFCENCITLLTDIFTQILSASSFFIILWSFDTPLQFHFYGIDVSIPHYLAWLCLAYALGVNLFMFWMGKPIIGLDFQQKKVEADFRYSLIRFKDHAEEIAFKKGEDFEKEVFHHKFSFIKFNYYKLMKFNFFLSLTKYGYTSTLFILPIIAALPLYLSDQIPFGSLMQINGACGQVLASLGVLITSYQSFALLHASKNRLYQFLHASEPSEESSNYTLSDRNEFALENVTILNHNKETILQNVNFQVLDKEKVLLMGKSGRGKTSILRTLNRLWHKHDGNVRVPQSEVYFIPQKPYFPLAKLSDCLLYPRRASQEDEATLSEALKEVHLENLIPLLDEEKDWSRHLSPGQQQRINFAKILLRKPKILVMDEPTSSMDKFHEQEMFRILSEKILKEATVLTISHSPDLKSYHDRCVELT